MLEIKKGTKAFGPNSVLRELDLTIPTGSIFGLVGINGAGKSTLLRTIAGVYRLNDGEILFEGKNTYLDANIRNEIAFVSDDLYFPTGSTIAGQRVFYENLYSFSKENYNRFLKMFELKEEMTISTLSKGNKRRVALLFALSIQPKLLLLDEAYDGLEPLIRLKFKKVLAQLVESEQLTVIISSHSLKELEDICDSFGILEGGKLLRTGDLLDSRDDLNKYQLVFKHDFTANDFKNFDVLHFEKEGHVYQLVIRGSKQEVQEELNNLNPLLLDVLPVNFEELFIYELESRGSLDE
ncbi:MULTISPECIES: ATP-binding cassette domain-containing protein [Terrabacteria group]|uniref:ATP-binding cassette domain-containing protein n=1 Tax=Bacillati TaxID=1783272 RepID=UPI001C6EFBE7|nr:MULTISPECIES: ABC transporter ATP-binding protein [Terrabacteria group]MBW9212307.1 ABC transporter ATP-binding protein [Trueperella sp. zg.1013]